MVTRLEEVAEILKLIDSSACEELVLELADMKLIVRRRGAGSQGDRIDAPAVETSMVGRDPSTTPARLPAARRSELGERQFAVSAPMVGTFYRAAAPGATPFVEIGSVVRPGDPLCLIEVMKLFTTIAADRAGRIAQIAAEDGEAVEYGRTLFVLDPV
jgi:acetyl-CoA carboxylase biotin carboxyl carrier protein